LVVLASRRSRSGDGRTRTANVAWRMKPAPHLASSPLQGSELHRVRFWPQVMSLVGFCCPDPCGAPAGNRTQCAGFGGPRSFHRQEQVASREGVEPSQAGFVDLPPDPPAETISDACENRTRFHGLRSRCPTSRRMRRRAPTRIRAWPHRLRRPRAVRQQERGDVPRNRTEPVQFCRPPRSPELHVVVEHPPGIEPGPKRWRRHVRPLHLGCNRERILGIEPSDAQLGRLAPHQEDTRVNGRPY
jgi:hypothetical protein